jgi:hypothetical protein
MFAASTGSLASGSIPKFARKELLESHTACVARLHDAYEAHRKMVAPRRVDPDGSTQEITLGSATNGVKIIGPSEARYEGRIWWHNGGSKITPEGMREVSHSWDEDTLHCAGEVLTSGGASGYTLSSFEPASGEVYQPKLELPKVRKKQNGKPRP